MECFNLVSWNQTLIPCLSVQSEDAEAYVDKVIAM